MSRAKIMRDSIPNPPYPSNAGREGGEAYNALANNVYATQHATGTATAGTMFAVIGIPIVPTVSGKILVQWNSSGTGANATASATYQPSVKGSTAGIPTMTVGVGGDAAHSFDVEGAFIFSGLPLNQTANVNISYTSASGITLPNGQGSLSVIELPS